MDASDAPPQQLTKSATKPRHIPPEILEIILLNLPLKSLLRFSSASISWHSMIFGSDFVKKFRRERILLTDGNNISTCPISAISPDNSPVDTEALLSPFGPTICVKAFCDDLWCVEDTTTNSLFLWNPLIRTYVKLPDPSRKFYVTTELGIDDDRIDSKPMPYDYMYGLGYDSVGDDYKILKVGLEGSFIFRVAELYSLRSNSWREIEPFPGDAILNFTGPSRRSVFAAGALHWMVVPDHSTVVPQLLHTLEPAIVSFDLSSNKYGRVRLPDFVETITNILITCSMEIVVLRGKLCLSLNYWETDRFELWVMEDYGVVESWTKKFVIDCNRIPCFKYGPILRPLHLYDNGNIVISRKSTSGGKMDKSFWEIASTGGKIEKNYSTDIFVYKDEETRWKKNFGIEISCSFVYFESLVSPALWRGTTPRTLIDGA